MIESETKLLPMISRALAFEGDAPDVPDKEKPLHLKRLEEIIKEDLS